MLEKNNQGEMLRDALTKLSPEHREIIDLVYYHACRHRETRMFYARKKLAEMVERA